MSKFVEQAFGLDTKKIEHLSITEVFQGISRLEAEGYCDADEEEITMVIGSTRCGKSTTINLLLGNSLISRTEGSGLGKKIAIVKAKDDPDELYPVIGTKSTSETTIPVKYTFDNKALWDCPGFGDTRGAQQEIINAWFVNRLFTTASKVKVINICAATSFVGTDNVKEFEKYIQQIEDVFGKKQIAGIQSVLVFTKTDSRFSAEDYKQESLKKIEELYPSNQEIQKFFENTTATKIDKVNSEGVALGKDYIPELLKLCDATAYQEMQPHVGVDDAAKVYLHQSIVDVSKAAMQNMLSAYKTAYNESLTNALELIYKKGCISKELPIVLKEFDEAKLKAQELENEAPAIIKELDTLKEISNFVLKIIPENNNIRELIATSVQACKYHNINASFYESEHRLLEFLINNSSNITDHDKLQAKWKTDLKQLQQKQPSSKDLTLSLETIYAKATDINNSLIEAQQKSDIEAQALINEEYKKNLEACQEEFKANSERVQQELNDARGGWWNLIPFVGQLVTAIITGSISGPDAIKEITKSSVKVLLDKSFSEFISNSNSPLLGEMDSYFEWIDTTPV